MTASVTPSIATFKTRDAMGRAAAADVGVALRDRLARQSTARMIFAAAPSQAEMLDALARERDIDWRRVTAFHMDEYIGLPSGAPERFGAWLIDFALVLTAVATVMVSVAIAIGAARADGEEVDDTRAAIVTFAAFGATFIGMALYNAIGIGWRETTLGKQAVGLVVRAEDGSRAGYGRAFNRELLGRVLVEGLLSAFTLGLFWIASGLAAAADRKRQAWHDKMGQTMVVYGRGERRPKAEEAPLPAEADDAALPAEDVRPAAA